MIRATTSGFLGSMMWQYCPGAGLLFAKWTGTRFFLNLRSFSFGVFFLLVVLFVIYFVPEIAEAAQQVI